MSETKFAIIATASSIITAITGWWLGGRQSSKATEKDSITKGADMIVESTQKLQVLFEKLLEQETERANIEKEHKEACEKKLAEIKKENSEIKSENNEIKKRLNQLEKVVGK
jgi:hypothetical protein